MQSNFSKIDTLSPEFLYNDYLTFIDSPAYNSRLEQNGYETANISINLGSFLTFFVYLFVKTGMKSLINYYLVRNATNPNVRKFGMWLGSTELKHEILSFSTSIYIEVFLPLVLQVHFMVTSDHSFKELLGGYGDIYNFVLLIISAFLCFYIPLKMIYTIRKFLLDELEEDEDQTFLSIAFEDLNVDQED